MRVDLYVIIGKLRTVFCKNRNYSGQRFPVSSRYLKYEIGTFLYTNFIPILPLDISSYSESRAPA